MKKTRQLGDRRAREEIRQPGRIVYDDLEDVGRFLDLAYVRDFRRVQISPKTAGTISLMLERELARRGSRIARRTRPNG